MGSLIAVAAAQELTIEIGQLPILLRTASPEFLRMLGNRYGGFVNTLAQPVFELEVEIISADALRGDPDQDLSVRFDDGQWILQRGDFRAELDLTSRRGRIRQDGTPYAIDAALRILHSLMLAQEGGLLVHAASAVRRGKAFLFAGVSGAGKTTISRLAPPDAALLTDEISYIRREPDGYFAYGTPFAGELARPGENLRAPLTALYLLAQGPMNRIDAVSDADATRALLKCVLFFAHDSDLVGRVFDVVCELVQKIPIQRLTFVPDSSAWEAIG
jgi:hypothetical protein